MFIVSSGMSSVVTTPKTSHCPEELRKFDMLLSKTCPSPCKLDSFDLPGCFTSIAASGTAESDFATQTSDFDSIMLSSAVLLTIQHDTPKECQCIKDNMSNVHFNSCHIGEYVFLAKLSCLSTA